MEFKWHILIGFITSYILVYFFEFPIFAGVIIFIASWIIDLDHYFWYALETKDWNPFHAIRWYIKTNPKWLALTPDARKKFKYGIFIYHSLLLWIILIMLSSIHPVFLWILIGIGIHMVADLIDLNLLDEPLYVKIFPCYTIRKNKNKKSLTIL